MTALLSLLALAADAPIAPRLDVAQPAEVLAAVQGCSRAVIGKAKVDHDALEAEGWKQDERRGIWVVRRKKGNAAIIIANSGQSSAFPGTLMQEVCMVRTRLGDASAPAAVADQVTRFAGVEPLASKRRQDKWFWRGASLWVGQEPFDPEAGGSSVTQLAVMPAPQPRPRPTSAASSQNKNQEPR